MGFRGSEVQILSPRPFENRWGNIGKTFVPPFVFLARRGPVRPGLASCSTEAASVDGRRPLPFLRPSPFRTGKDMTPLSSKELPVPVHYEPARVREIWRVPYQERAVEAEQWTAQHAIRPSAEDFSRVSLLLVDMQNTFCIPGFELPFADAGMHIVRSVDPVSSWPGIPGR
jgi:hypothetical protein